MGVELFSREKRQIALTAAGTEFLLETRALFAQLDVAVARAREAGRGLRGELRIAYTVSAMITALPGAIRAYRADHPNVRITLRAMEPRLLFDALRRHEIDAGVLLEPSDGARLGGVDVRRIGTLPFAVVVPEGHRLADRRTIAVEEIGTEPLIVLDRRLTDVYDVVLALCRERNFAPARVTEVDRVETVLGLVAAGEGVSIVPRIYETLRFRGLAYFALAPAPKPFSLIVARSSDGHSELAGAFYRMVKPAFASADLASSSRSSRSKM